MCAACNTPLQIANMQTSIFEAMGRQYHAGCFVCGHCGKGFDDGKYVWNSKLEQPFHATCAAEANAPKCEKCNKPLDASFAMADDKMYHWDCFTCDTCGCSLEDGYTMQDGKPFCKEHRKSGSVKVSEGDKYTLDSRTLEKIYREADTGRKYRLKLGVKYYEDEKPKPKYGGATTWRTAS